MISNRPTHSTTQSLTQPIIWQRVIVALWSFFFTAIILIAKVMGYVWPKLAGFISARTQNSRQLEIFATKRTQHPLCALFYCSSAGEYEQALPIIEALEETLGQKLFIHILFFSESGLKFARAREETRSFSLAPLDTLKEWHKLLAAINPSLTVIIRHELWPAFILSCKRYGPIYLANASFHGSFKAHRGTRKLIKRFLLAQFDYILAVSGEDKQLFGEIYKLRPEKVTVTGDSKYDRALARAQRISAHSLAVQSHIQQIFADLPLFIIGSAWEEDIELCFRAYEIRRQQNFPISKMIIAPHAPTKEFVDKLCKSCQNFGITYCLYSDIENSFETPVDALIIDSIGMLAEIYRCGTWAWVGGALHNQVHNILEPASHGLAIAFGPKYQNSQEAVKLVKTGLAKVFRRAEELAGWWHYNEQAKTIGQSTLSYLKPLSGAAKRMTKYLVFINE